MLHNQEFKEVKINARDLICFSHLRWDFVYQRPQHLMSRFNKYLRVFFIEEPIFYACKDKYTIKKSESGVYVVTPMLNENDKDLSSVIQRQKKLICSLIAKKQITNYIAWYYTPMALKISSQLTPELIVYDCMDELSAFKFAPVELKLMEAELFKKADIVFTGGFSLYEAKKNSHGNIFPFPSSIEKEHFLKARNSSAIPFDQKQIVGNKIGFYGVIDERFNINLIAEVAAKRPDWNFILIGPVVKINPEDLPRRKNIHYLGGKLYKELPDYLAGWDIAMIPFEKNESTRFISPTKTPEYLAAGKPVISSSITDVVTPYGKKKLVHIADNSDDFIAAAEWEFAMSEHERKIWLNKVDTFLKEISWDNCIQDMIVHLSSTLTAKQTVRHAKAELKSVA